MQLMDMFPTEEAATAWFESVGERGALLRKVWEPQNEGSSERQADALLVHGLPLLFFGSDGHADRTLERSASQVGHRNLSLPHEPQERVQHEAPPRYRRGQPTAWFMLHRIREAWAADNDEPYDGPVEFDETHVGGKRKNKSNAERKELTGRGPVDMTLVVGAKDRATNNVSAKVLKHAGRAAIQEFVAENAEPDAVVFTDDAAAYEGIPNPHETVNHSVSEFVRGMAHTNGIESFWSMLKRAHGNVSQD